MLELKDAWRYGPAAEKLAQELEGLSMATCVLDCNNATARVHEALVDVARVFAQQYFFGYYITIDRNLQVIPSGKRVYFGNIVDAVSQATKHYTAEGKAKALVYGVDYSMLEVAEHSGSGSWAIFKDNIGAERVQFIGTLAEILPTREQYEARKKQAGGG